MQAATSSCALPGPTCELALLEECEEGVLQADSLDCYLTASTLLGVIHHAHTPGQDTHKRHKKQSVRMADASHDDFCCSIIITGWIITQLLVGYLCLHLGPVLSPLFTTECLSQLHTIPTPLPEL